MRDLRRVSTSEVSKLPARWLKPCRRSGLVLAAVIEVLKASEGPMRAKEIHVAVEAQSDEPIAWSSIKNCLASNLAGPSPRFVRLGRGLYCLSDATAA